jgi:3-oxoadipate enol-lactonase
VNDVPAETSTHQHRGITPTSLVESYFAALGTGDIEGALALLTEDVIWHVDGAVGVSTVGLLQGRERVRRWLERFPQNFKPLVFAIDRLFESGDEVMAVGRFRHTVLATSRTAGSDLAIRFTVRDGQIARYQILEDSLLLARAFDPDGRWDFHEVKVNGAAYAYSDRGEGRVVIFAHGLFVDHTIFDAQVADLESAHRCISLDMPGHGRSGYREAGWTLDDVADDLALMIEEQSLGPVAFVGQSQGAWLAFASPRVDRNSSRSWYSLARVRGRKIQNALPTGMPCVTRFSPDRRPSAKPPLRVCRNA